LVNKKQSAKICLDEVQSQKADSQNYTKNAKHTLITPNKEFFPLLPLWFGGGVFII